MAEFTEENRALALAHVWGMSVGHSSSFGIKIISKLGIPDMIVEQGPLSLQEITERLPGSNVQTEALERLMDFMSIREIFDTEEDPKRGRIYKPNDNTKMCTMEWFGGLLQVQDDVITAGWHKGHEYILHGGPSPFERAHGKPVWHYMAQDMQFAMRFSKAMVAMSNVIMTSVLEHYRGFADIKGTLVDCGGGSGDDIRRIVEKYPHIKGINFELPFLANTAPPHKGVEHVAGDMMESIPQADAALFKAVLHSFEDARVILALKNCYKVLPDGGRVMIVDIVTDPEGGPFDKLKFAFDSVLLALSDGGRERSKKHWTKLLKAANFERINVVHIPHCLHAVIEAYKPE